MASNSPIYGARFMNMIALACSLLVSGCLNSPLLNHVKAGQVRIRERDVPAAGCQLSFPNQNLCATFIWERQPAGDEGGEFVLRFWDPRTATESGPFTSPELVVSAKLWMPSMGHGSAPVRMAPILDSGNQVIPGVYRGSNVYFTMGGHWELWVQLKQDSTVVEQAKIEFDI